VSTWSSLDTVGLSDRKGDQLVMPGCAKCQPLSVSVDAMQTSVTHQLLKVKQTTVQFEENSAAFCCACQFHRRHVIWPKSNCHSVGHFVIQKETKTKINTKTDETKTKI